MIKLGQATPNQIRYACLRYHYARTIPTSQVSFSCYEDDEFIGVIMYGGGASPKLGRQYGLIQGEYLELVRVALNGKQKSPTSKFVALSMKLVKKQKPFLKLLISFADKSVQNHKGTIYYATNWVYDGISRANHLIINGRLTHPRSAWTKYGKDKSKWPKDTQVAKNLEKHRFIYPLDRKWYTEYERQKHKSNVA